MALTDLFGRTLNAVASASELVKGLMSEVKTVSTHVEEGKDEGLKKFDELLELLKKFRADVVDELQQNRKAFEDYVSNKPATELDDGSVKSRRGGFHNLQESTARALTKSDHRTVGFSNVDAAVAGLEPPIRAASSWSDPGVSHTATASPLQQQGLSASSTIISQMVQNQISQDNQTVKSSAIHTAPMVPSSIDVSVSSPNPRYTSAMITTKTLNVSAENVNVPGQPSTSTPIPHSGSATVAAAAGGTSIPQDPRGPGGFGGSKGGSADLPPLPHDSSRPVPVLRNMNSHGLSTALMSFQYLSSKLYGMVDKFMKAFDFEPSQIVKGAISDEMQYITNIRAAAYETTQFGENVKRVGDDWLHLERTSLRTGQWRHDMQKLYMKQSQKGLTYEMRMSGRSQKLVRRQLRDQKAMIDNAAQTAFVIGSNLEETTDVFDQWQRGFGLTNNELSSMGDHLKVISKRTGVSGDNMLRVAKSAEQALKTMKQAGMLNPLAMSTVLQKHALYEKYGVEEFGQTIDGALSSWKALTEAPVALQSIIHRAVMATGGMVDVLDLRTGTVNTTPEKAKAFNEGLAQAIKASLAGLAPDLDNLANLDYYLQKLAQGVAVDTSKMNPQERQASIQSQKARAGSIIQVLENQGLKPGDISNYFRSQQEFKSNEDQLAELVQKKEKREERGLAVPPALLKGIADAQRAVQQDYFNEYFTAIEKNEKPEEALRILNARLEQRGHGPVDMASVNQTLIKGMREQMQSLGEKSKKEVMAAMADMGYSSFQDLEKALISKDAGVTMDAAKDYRQILNMLQQEDKSDESAVASVANYARKMNDWISELSQSQLLKLTPDGLQKVIMAAIGAQGLAGGAGILAQFAQMFMAVGILRGMGGMVGKGKAAFGVAGGILGKAKGIPGAAARMFGFGRGAANAAKAAKGAGNVANAAGHAANAAKAANMANAAGNVANAAGDAANAAKAAGNAANAAKAAGNVAGVMQSGSKGRMLARWMPTIAKTGILGRSARAAAAQQALAGGLAAGKISGAGKLGRALKAIPGAGTVGSAGKVVGKYIVPATVVASGAMRQLDTDAMAQTYGKKWEEMTEREKGSARSANLITGALSGLDVITPVKDLFVSALDMVGVHLPDSIRKFDLAEALGLGPDGAVTKSLSYVTGTLATAGEAAGDLLGKIWGGIQSWASGMGEVNKQIADYQSQQVKEGTFYAHDDPRNKKRDKWDREQAFAEDMYDAQKKLGISLEKKDSTAFDREANDLIVDAMKQTTRYGVDGRDNWTETINLMERAKAEGVTLDADAEKNLAALKGMDRRDWLKGPVRAELTRQGMAVGMNGVTKAQFDAALETSLAAKLKKEGLTAEGMTQEEAAIFNGKVGDSVGEMAKQATEPGSIYTHDIHVEEMYKSALLPLMSKILDAIANIHSWLQTSYSTSSNSVGGVLSESSAQVTPSLPALGSPFRLLQSGDVINTMAGTIADAHSKAAHVAATPLRAAQEVARHAEPALSNVGTMPLRLIDQAIGSSITSSSAASPLRFVDRMASASMSMISGALKAPLAIVDRANKGETTAAMSEGKGNNLRDAHNKAIDNDVNNFMNSEKKIVVDRKDHYDHMDTTTLRESDISTIATLLDSYFSWAKVFGATLLDRLPVIPDRQVDVGYDDIRQIVGVTSQNLGLFDGDVYSNAIEQALATEQAKLSITSNDAAEISMPIIDMIRRIAVNEPNANQTHSPSGMLVTDLVKTPNSLASDRNETSMVTSSIQRHVTSSDMRNKGLFDRFHPNEALEAADDVFYHDLVYRISDAPELPSGNLVSNLYQRRINPDKPLVPTFQNLYQNNDVEGVMPNNLATQPSSLRNLGLFASDVTTDAQDSSVESLINNLSIRSSATDTHAVDDELKRYRSLSATMQNEGLFDHSLIRSANESIEDFDRSKFMASHVAKSMMDSSMRSDQVDSADIHNVTKSRLMNYGLFDNQVIRDASDVVQDSEVSKFMASHVVKSMVDSSLRSNNLVNNDARDATKSHLMNYGLFDSQVIRDTNDVVQDSEVSKFMASHVVKSMMDSSLRSDNLVNNDVRDATKSHLMNYGLFDSQVIRDASDVVQDSEVSKFMTSQVAKSVMDSSLRSDNLVNNDIRDATKSRLVNYGLFDNQVIRDASDVVQDSEVSKFTTSQVAKSMMDSSLRSDNLINNDVRDATKSSLLNYGLFDNKMVKDTYDELNYSSKLSDLHASSNYAESKEVHDATKSSLVNYGLFNKSLVRDAVSEIDLGASMAFANAQPDGASESSPHRSSWTELARNPVQSYMRSMGLFDRSMGASAMDIAQDADQAKFLGMAPYVQEKYDIAVEKDEEKVRGPIQSYMRNLGLFSRTSIDDTEHEYISLLGKQYGVDLNGLSTSRKPVSRSGRFKGYISSNIIGQGDTEEIVSRHVEGSKPSGPATLLPGLDGILDYLMHDQARREKEMLDLLSEIRDSLKTQNVTMVSTGDPGTPATNRTGLKNVARELLTGSMREAMHDAYSTQSNITGTDR